MEELWGLCADPTYRQEGASAFLGRSLPPGEAKQHRDAAHHQAQVTNMKQVCGGQPKDLGQDSPSEIHIDAQTNEDHARELQNRKQEKAICQLYTNQTPGGGNKGQ